MFSMNTRPDVLDISSDEEEGGLEGDKRSNYDWVMEYLGVYDKELDDSDDVIIVDEKKMDIKSKSLRPPVIKSTDNDDDDDDCVILDGDPEKAVESVDKSVIESDELIVMAEKGQIACRDYPHPRHHCATFPFSSTPHERHCEKCHCYVCDLPAPCPKWGTGTSSADHCHATEKVEMWQIQRKNFKLKSAPLSAPTNYGSLLHVKHSQQNRASSDDISDFANTVKQYYSSRLTSTHSCPSTPHPITQNNGLWAPVACSSSLNSNIRNQTSRANAIPTCPSPANLMVPNSTNHSKSQVPVSTYLRNRHQPSYVRNNPFQRGRRRGSSNLCPQYPRRILNSNGLGNTGRTPRVNLPAYGSSGYSSHVNPAVRYSKHCNPPAFSNDRARSRWNNHILPANFPTRPYASSACRGVSYTGENAVASVASEIRAYTPPPRFENSPIFNQPGVQGNEAPSKDVACLSGTFRENGHQIGSQMENVGGDIFQRGNSNQESCHLQPAGDNHDATAPKTAYPIVDSVLKENSSQGIEPQNDNPQPPVTATGSITQPPSLNDCSSMFAGRASLGALDDFDDWLREKDSALHSELNILSPDPNPADMGELYFDFDSIWNGLAPAT